MPMNVKPIPTLDERINEIRMKTAEIVNEWILPNEAKLWGFRRGGQVSDHDRRQAVQLREEIKEVVWRAGLWAPHLPKEYGGMGLDFLAHAYMNEVLAYAVGAASLFGVVAPNSGNQAILVKYGTEEQKEQWLLPLVDGKMESGFSMTEPENAGSDPRSLTTSAVLDGDQWVINGHKWFTSNGIDADFFIVMARVADSDEEAKRRQGRMAQFIVPTATKGVNIVRGIGVWGRRESDHCEVIYDNVRIPKDNILNSTASSMSSSTTRLSIARFHLKRLAMKR
jgi:acyl-CoA dehydrogenase